MVKCVPIRIRYTIAVAMCLGSMIYFIIQSNMSIIILAMTKPIYNTTSEPPDYGPRYEWSAYDQSLVLGSLSWGSMIITPFAGTFAERYGVRYICGFAFIAAAIFTALAPVTANILWLTIVLRFLTGTVMATVVPSMQALIANWVPPEEKGLFSSSLLANGLGTVIDWSMSGFIIEHLGWHYAFYIVFIILGIFSTIWFVIVFDSPIKHPRITIAERQYILSKITTSKKKPWPPLRSILLSVPFWALFVSKFGSSYGMSFFMNGAPRYLSEVHGYTISKTGVVASIPYIMRFLGGISFGLIGDFLLKRKIMSATYIRKCFSFFSHIIPGCLLICLTFFGSQSVVCVVFISLAMGFSGATTITNLQNPHDISPNFAATIYSLGGIGAFSTGFIAPVVIAYFTQERSSEEEWRYIFFIGAGVFIGTAIVFILFGSGSIQKWDHIDEDVDETIDENNVYQEKSSKIKDKNSS